MTIANDTICHRCRQQRLNCTKNGDGESWRHEALDHIPRQLRHLCSWQLIGNTETVADSLNTHHAHILFEQKNANGHHNDGDERTGQFLQDIIIAGYFRPERNDCYRADTHASTPPVDSGQRTNIGNPLLNKIARNRSHRQTEEILDLRGKDGQGDTRGKAHYNGVRNIFDDGAQMEHTKHNEEDTRQKCGNGQTLETILLDNTINNNNECARRTTYLNFGSTKD